MVCPFRREKKSEMQNSSNWLAKFSLALLVALFSGCGDDSGSSGPSSILFSSNTDANLQIHVMDQDGSNNTRLTNNSSVDYTPAWSPDRSRIVFASDRSGNSQIYVMNADGSEQTRLTSDTSNDRDPAWSPDGSRIAFASYPQGNSQIYVINVDGSNLTQITFDSSNNGYPAWSPDGNQIAFVSDRDTDPAKKKTQIYLMNSDGSQPTRISEDSLINDTLPAWSPDGQKIAFARGAFDQTKLIFVSSFIYVMDNDGSNQTLLTDYLSFSTEPAWTP